jgi:hypothetical protein
LQTPGAVQGAQRASNIARGASSFAGRQPALTRRCTATPQASARTLPAWLRGRLDLRAAEDRADRLKRRVAELEADVKAARKQCEEMATAKTRVRR